MQKGGEAVDSTGFDCDITEAENGTKGSIQEQEVLAAGPSSQEDQSHP